MRLLLLEDLQRKYFLLITDLGKVMSIHNKHNRRKFVCNYCFPVCVSRSVLTNHHKQCLVKNENKQSVRLPPEYSKMKLENHGKQFRGPFVICADFECTLENTDDPSKPQIHISCGHAYKVVCCYDSKYNTDLVLDYRDKDTSHLLSLDF